MTVEANANTSSGTSGDYEDDELQKRHRVFCLQVVQRSDVEVRKRLIKVWNEVLYDVCFLEAVASEFERKEVEERIEYFLDSDALAALA
jgi:hypothetical protein